MYNHFKSAKELTRAEIELLLKRAAETAQTPESDDQTEKGVESGEIGDQLVLQALADVAAIRTAKGTLDGLQVALLGDLKSGIQAQTFARLLGRFDVRLSFVSTAALSMPYDLSEELRGEGLEVEETNDLVTTLRKADVLYLSRVDPSRLEKKVYEKARQLFALSPNVLREATPGVFILGDWEGAEELLEPGQRIRQFGLRRVLRALTDRPM